MPLICNETPITRYHLQMIYPKPQLKRLARNNRNNPTEGERALWQYLRNRNLEGRRFARQYVIGNAIVDFACPRSKLIIELDGGQHDLNRRTDDLRTQRLNEHGYTVIRFWNNEVLTNIEGVLQAIQQALRGHT